MEWYCINGNSFRQDYKSCSSFGSSYNCSAGACVNQTGNQTI